jgi:hypothetical protein
MKMAKYEINYKCGHKGTVDLYGKHKDRERKIEWLESDMCPNCKAAVEIKEKEAQGWIAKEMPYREYKQNYPDNLTQKGTYNEKTKTIVVYIKKEENEPKKEKTQENMSISDFERALAKMEIKTEEALKSAVQAAFKNLSTEEQENLKKAMGNEPTMLNAIAVKAAQQYNENKITENEMSDIILDFIKKNLPR